MVAGHPARRCRQARSESQECLARPLNVRATAWVYESQVIPGCRKPKATSGPSPRPAFPPPKILPNDPWLFV